MGSEDKVLVVEDVMTTGGSVKELIEVIKECGSEIIGIGTIVDRSSGKIDLGYDIHSLIKMDIKTFKPEDCPLCKEGTPITKQGSRK